MNVLLYLYILKACGRFIWIPKGIGNAIYLFNYNME